MGAGGITRVVIESPYAGELTRNAEYLRKAIRECSKRGESVYASHRMLTEALDDTIPEERALGIELGLEWRRVADKRIFYVDRGWSSGMLAARELYFREGYSYELRRIGGVGPVRLVPGDWAKRAVVVLDRWTAAFVAWIERVGGVEEE